MAHWRAALKRSRNKAAAFGFRNRVSKLFGRLDPQFNRALNVCQSGLAVIAVRNAPGQFRDFRDKSAVLTAPVDDDLVPIHGISDCISKLRIAPGDLDGLALLPSLYSPRPAFCGVC